MGRIIHCADLIIRVEEDTVIGTNLTQWILESTDFRPTNMDTCTVSDEMSSYEKLWLISVVWLTLIVLSFLYCYFCEQRLFSSSRQLFDHSQVRHGGRAWTLPMGTQVVDSKGLLANGKCPNNECNTQYKRSVDLRTKHFYCHISMFDAHLSRTS
jgi:hypothetical protein